MFNTNYMLTQPRRSCIASFQTLYGIGKIKAAKLNNFLLNHPKQKYFTKHFREVLYPSYSRHVLEKIPVGERIRLCVANHLQKKIIVFCYQMYRLFQDLPTKGQRTHANGHSHSNQNPYKNLRINLSFYHSYTVAYKKRELLYNERFDELKAFITAQAQRERMQKQDRKEMTRKARQNYIRNNKTKYVNQ